MRWHAGWYRLLAFASVAVALTLVASPASAQALLPAEVVFLRRIALGKLVIGSFGLAAFVCLTLSCRERSRIPRILAPMMAAAAWLGAAWMSKAGLSHFIFGSVAHRVVVVAFAISTTVVWLSSMVRRRPEVARRIAERGTLIALMLASVLAYSNFAVFHGKQVVHFWEAYHYYMGSKYFAENGYDGLYVSSLLAERDDGRPAAADRQALDLRTNELLDASELLAQAPSVREVFAPDRWRAFRQDSRLFHSFFTDHQWSILLLDHGYNATPVWTMFGSALTNVGWQTDLPPEAMEYSPANMRSRPRAEREQVAARFTLDRDRFASELKRLVLVDALLYAGMFLGIGWAFGLRASALAVMVFSLGDPWSYFWTGGALGRAPWLFSAVAGVCLVKKGWMLAGGFSLAGSFLLRIFPVALWCGVALRAGWLWLHSRKLDPATLRMVGGAALAVGILFSASLWTTGGVATWREFLANSAKHVDTPLVNHMGLATLLAWDSERTIEKLGVAHSEAAVYEWQDARRSTFEDRKLGFVLASLAVFALLALAVRGSEAWEATILGTVSLIVLFELTSYYYCFFVLLAPYCIARLRHTLVLLLVLLAGQAVHLLTSALDERYFWQTALVLGAYLYLLVDAVLAARANEPARSGAADAGRSSGPDRDTGLEFP